jgi:GNAT superfamily N-acetyltransferase
MSEPVIRLTRPTDINALKDLDLKTYQYPLELDQWQARINGSGKPDESMIVVTEVYRKPVAYAMWNIDKEHNGVHLERLGVLPKFRRNGLGSRLIQRCMQYGYDKFCEEVRIVIPSIYCCPGEPDDVSAFMNANQFKPNGTIAHNMRKMYGESVDGYVFARPIDVNPSRL